MLLICYDIYKIILFLQDVCNHLIEYASIFKIRNKAYKIFSITNIIIGC